MVEKYDVFFPSGHKLLKKKLFKSAAAIERSFSLLVNSQEDHLMAA